VVATDEVLTPGDAYLYGRFHVVNPIRNRLTQNPQTMGFAFDCADGKYYVVRFEATGAVQAIKITPSACALTHFVFTHHDAIKYYRKPVPDSLRQPTAFEAGKGYYLGDFQAETTASRADVPQTEFPGQVGATTLFWRLRSARNNYAHTTTQLKSAYPGLSALPTEDRMILQNERTSR
jgi:hypothetical protein